MSAIISGDRPSRPTNSGFTDNLWTLTQQCWDQDAGRRPKALRISCNLHVLAPDRVYVTDQFLRCSDLPVWKHLADSPITMDQRVSLIADILSDQDEIDAFKALSGGDAQSVIDVIDEVLVHLHVRTTGRPT